MQVEVVMPKMGESIQEGKILRWAKKIGEKISKDETILEISTDKVDSEIPSPVAGILATIVVQEGDTVPVGTVIAIVETDASVKQQSSPAPVAAHAESTTTTPNSAQQVLHARKAIFSIEEVSGHDNGNRFYSPLVRSIAKAEGISLSELDRLAGSGAGGRVNKADLLNYLKSRTGAVRRDDYSIHKVDLN